MPPVTKSVSSAGPAMTKLQVIDLISSLAAQLHAQVNLQALFSALVTAELASPLSDPLPAVIAAAESIFPDPAFRAFAVWCLQEAEKFIKTGTMREQKAMAQGLAPDA